MARSRSIAGCLLITRMFMLLLICLDSTKAAMGYDLLLATGRSCFYCVGADILIPPFWLSVSHCEGGMCIAAKLRNYLSKSISLLSFSVNLIFVR